MKPANPSTPMPVVSPANYDTVVDDILTAEDVHDANTVTEATATNGLFILVAIVLTLLHAFNLYLFLGTTIWPIVPILIHILISFVTCLIAWAQYRNGMDVQHMGLMAILSATTGIFGTVGALVGYVSALLFRTRSLGFSEWYASIFPTDIPTDPETIYDRIIEGIDENPSRYGVMPFTDVMRLGSENQKRRALAKMTSRFSPRFAPAFKIALSDTSNTIRVQAATAVAKIERDFAAKLDKIELARSKEPHNPVLTLALAKFYDDYAFTGVLDPELEKLNRERAVNTYKSYLEQDPNNVDAWMAIGRLMYRNKEWSEAAEWFRHALDRGLRTNTMVLWYFECLFRLGQYRDLRRVLLEYGRGIITKDDLPIDVRNAVSLWMDVA